MPAKEKRKIMKHGSSGVVAIPKSYLDYYQLQPGDEVDVLYDSLLLLIPRKLAGLLEARKALIDELLGSPEERHLKQGEIERIKKMRR